MVHVIKLIMMRYNILLAWYPSEKDCCTKYCDIGTKILIFDNWLTQHLKCYITLRDMLSLQNQNASCKFQTLPTCQIKIFHFSAACLYDHFASRHRILLCLLLSVNKHFAVYFRHENGLSGKINAINIVALKMGECDFFRFMPEVGGDIGNVRISCDEKTTTQCDSSCLKSVKRIYAHSCNQVWA